MWALLEHWRPWMAHRQWEGDETPTHPHTHTMTKGTLPRAEQPIPMYELLTEVRRARASFVDTLRGFDTPGSAMRQMLDGVGCPGAVTRDRESVLFCRRMCLQMSAGLFRRLELRLASQPYRLWVLCVDGTSEAERLQAVEEFLQLPECCLGWFGTRLRRLFSTRQALLAPLAKTVLSSWLSTLIFSIYACEREHASMRRLISGVGPARNFSLVARERVLEGTRTINIERGCSDPVGCNELVPGKRRKPLPIATEPSAASPLYPPAVQATWGGNALATAGPEHNGAQRTTSSADQQVLGAVRSWMPS